MKIFRSLVYSFTIVLLLYSSFANAQTVNWKWCKSATGTAKAMDEATSIAVDGSGNIYAAGDFRSASLNFGSVTLTNVDPTTTEIFLAKYNVSGTLLWARTIGNKGNETAYDLSVDAAGNIYLAGSFESDTIDLGKGVKLINSNVWEDPFIAKFTTAGDAIWAKSAGGADRDFASGVAIDASGNAYIIGYYASDTLVFSKAPLTQITRAGDYDIYIAKYNNNGDFQWVRSAGGEMEDKAYGIAVDNSGNAIITGQFQSSTITFGSYPLTNANNWSDMFLTKYNPTGDVIWTKIVTGDYYETGNSVATDPSGNIYVCGDFSSDNITIGTTTLTNAIQAYNSDDIFVVKYNSSGQVQWANCAGGTAYDYAKGIAVDNYGTCYVTGNFGSTSFTIGSTSLANTDVTGSTGDIYVIKYTTSGGVIKALQAKSNGDDDAKAIAAYGNNAYIAGTYKANPKIYFDANYLSNSGDYDIVIAALGYGSSIKDEEFDKHFAVFPNPVHDQFSLSAIGIPSGKYSFKMYDVTGKLLNESNVDFNLNNVHQVSVPAGYKGLLMVMITSETGQVYTRSVICN